MQIEMPPDNALQRTVAGGRRCNSRVLLPTSLRLGAWAARLQDWLYACSSLARSREVASQGVA